MSEIAYTYTDLDHLPATEVLAVMFSLDQEYIERWAREHWEADDRPMPEL